MTYTLDQIRQAGKEGEVNHLDVEHIIDLLKEGSEAWVSVETPPDKKGYYLCYDTNFGSDQPIDVLFYQPYNDSWFYKADTFHPQFWQPLPPMPNSDMQTNGASQEQPNSKENDGNQKEPLYRWVIIKSDKDLPKEDGIYLIKDSEHAYPKVEQMFYSSSSHTKWHFLNARGQKTENVIINKSHVTEWLCKVETPEQDELWQDLVKYLNHYNSQNNSGQMYFPTLDLKSKYLLIKK